MIAAEFGRNGPGGPILAGCAEMEVLLIESDARRRVTVARHLASNSHRVTIASSVDEAQEMLRFVTDDVATPKVVIIDEKLNRGEGSELRAELAVRFPDTSWIPLREDLELDWLARWLELLAKREARIRKRKGTAPLNILLIEGDKALRGVLSRHLALWGDHVTACRSFRDAGKALDRFARHGKVPRAIMSQVAVGEEDGIGFYLSAKRRFPKARWIVVTPPESPLHAKTFAETATSVLDDMRRARRSLQQQTKH